MPPRRGGRFKWGRFSLYPYGTVSIKAARHANFITGFTIAYYHQRRIGRYTAQVIGKHTQFTYFFICGSRFKLI